VLFCFGLHNILWFPKRLRRDCNYLLLFGGRCRDFVKYFSNNIQLFTMMMHLSGIVNNVVTLCFTTSMCTAWLIGVMITNYYILIPHLSSIIVLFFGIFLQLVTIVTGTQDVTAFYLFFPLYYIK